MGMMRNGECAAAGPREAEADWGPWESSWRAPRPGRRARATTRGGRARLRDVYAHPRRMWYERKPRGAHPHALGLTSPPVSV
jgi:hypothetical protein